MYFLTTKNLGKTVVVQPRVQNDATSDRPCICVAPTVEECLFAIGELELVRVVTKKGFYYKQRSTPYRIYQCVEKGYPQYKLFDFRFTHEHRIYRPTKFWFKGIVEESRVKETKKVMNRFYDLIDEWERLRGILF